MKYLIFDTNIWIYLANSYNSLIEKHQDGLHFKLVESLEKLIADSRIQILTSYIILEEWERNKEKARDLIDKHRKNRDNVKGRIKNMKKIVDKEFKNDLDRVFFHYDDKIQEIIKANEEHIEKVENLLKKLSIEITVSKDTKALAADLAQGKSAPFIGDKKNSMADALILLSSIEYIKSKEKLEYCEKDDDIVEVYPNSIFISFNKNDFSNPEEREEIHPHLKKFLLSVGMEYKLDLGRLLNEIQQGILTSQEVEELKKIAEKEYWDNVHYCIFCEPEIERGILNTVESSYSIPFDSDNLEVILSSDDEIIDEEDEYKALVDINSIELFRCQNCRQEYFECPNCNNITPIEGIIADCTEVNCSECGFDLIFYAEEDEDELIYTKAEILI